MDIDKVKCEAWNEMLIKLIKMSKELNKDEVKYIKTTFAISDVKLESRELEKNNEKSVCNLKKN